MLIQIINATQWDSEIATKYPVVGQNNEADVKEQLFGYNTKDTTLDHGVSVTDRLFWQYRPTN